MAEAIMLVGFALGMLGLAHLLRPPIRRRIAPRTALMMVVGGLALAYAGLALTGQYDAVQELLSRHAPDPPRPDQ
jgi:sulfite exporter TauE/SafE